tara:strand:+ start:238 stop:495 length:258 start_codon:yes stop_codon:yes gene_type:complete
MSRINPVALLIQNKWREITSLAEEYREDFDEEEVDKSLELGFWSVVQSFCGDIELTPSFSINHKTRLLYGLIDEEEYQMILSQNQ